MRNEGISKFLFITTIVLAVVLVLNIVGLHMVRRQYAPNTTAGASLFNLSGQAREWSGYIRRWRDLANENARLRDLVAQNVSSKTTIDLLQADNDLLRKSMGLGNKLNRHLLPAGIFGVSLATDGYSALINKGSTSSVMVGQVVASPTGELIGRVTNVFSTSSRVMLISDPAFSVTAKVLGGQTSGIAHGALADGLNFDLVTQADTISEGDTIVTTGNDLVPAGLVVGVVQQVNNNDTQLFKKIRISPSIQPGQGSVVVIQ